MTKSAIRTDRAPAAIGPYSQAVRSGDLLFLSGQIALDPASGQLVGGGAETETQRVLTNITEVLGAAGASWADVVKTTIFLTSMDDFAIVNRLYGEKVGPVPPARSTVQVAALPKGATVEIETIARVPAGR
jgi:2-iminobutanoate/2-iminopropanoate deaminase